MAFVAEDGSGKSDANSYVSLADANTYFTDYGEPAEWTAASDSEKQVALVKGTQYLDSHYRWVSGEIGSSTQALAWPRDGAYDRHGRYIESTIVPEQVKQAACEAAVRDLQGEILGDLTQKVVEEEVSGAVRVRYDPNASQGTSYPIIDQLLTGLAASTNYEVEIVRS